MSLPTWPTWAYMERVPSSGGMWHDLRYFLTRDDADAAECDVLRVPFLDVPVSIRRAWGYV